MSPRAYYNEADPFKAEHLRRLAAAGAIAPGDVDDRSIEEVSADDLRGYTQCHFFAGIGGWSLALRLAAWPDERHVWTASLPCQPFSIAGAGRGFADERHLFPVFAELVGACRPELLLGEQSSSRRGVEWLDHVFHDLAGRGFADLEGADCPACAFGAPHQRRRMYWRAGRTARAMADCMREGLQARQQPTLFGEGRPVEGGATQQRREALPFVGGPRPTSGPWADPDWIQCRDGRRRPVERGTSPVAHGVPSRVVRACSDGEASTVSPVKAWGETRAGMIHAYGDAIVPTQAASLIRLYMNRGRWGEP